MTRSYDKRRQARKAIAYMRLYGAATVQVGRQQGSYPPIVDVDLKDMELRALAGRDPYGEDA
jgi:type II secretory pathway pseudopilin PulG